MWLFTQHGFFSVVCARQGDGSHAHPVDPNRVMVRARLRVHLEALKARFPQEFDGCEIETAERTDYAHRVFLPKKTWANVIAALAEETDYDNFKSTVRRHQGASDYERSLHKVWELMLGLQTKS